MMISRPLKLLRQWWRLLIMFATPLVFLPLPIIVPTAQARCAYVVLILTIYWVSEATPYAVTSLFPLAFFPLAGIIPSAEVGLSYFKDISTLFLGSMILARSMEHVNLHRRLALLVLSIVGTSVKWSMGGLMAVTAFLSMWINNSAATSIMIPAAVAIVDELESYQSVGKEDESRRPSKQLMSSESTAVFEVKTYAEASSNGAVVYQENVPLDSILQKVPNHGTALTPTANIIATERSADYSKLKTAFLISVAYSAAIGGLATLVGTGPNIFIKGYTDDFYSTGPYAFEISFTNFLLFAFPIGVVMLLLCWLWLQLLYNHRELLPWIKTDAYSLASQKHLKSVLKDQYRQLGSPSWQEYTVAILFLTMVALWVTRDFSGNPGWEIVFAKGYVTDATVALLIGSLTLILPNRSPFSNQWEYHPILQWDQLSKKFPWGVFMLQGAGLAIADGFKRSDLSSTIATFLHFIIGASDTTIIFVVIVLSAVFTEFTSNLACASILFPILDSVAITTGIHGARLILSSCMAVSLSFMLPIATPPNAMIFSSGNVRIIDLVKVGIGIKLLGVAVILLASMTTLSPIFRIHDAGLPLNSTLLTNHSSNG